MGRGSSEKACTPLVEEVVQAYVQNIVGVMKDHLRESDLQFLHQKGYIERVLQI